MGKSLLTTQSKSFIAAFLVCLVGVAAVKTLDKNKLNFENFSQIEVGMSYGDVTSLIGRPFESVWQDEDKCFLFCVWAPTTYNASVTFCEGKVYLKEW